MNSRFFKVVSDRLPFISKHYSTRTRPPVLLLGENHASPAAKDAIYKSTRDLKERGYDMFMSEGINGGHTLEEELAHAQNRNKTMKILCNRNPEFIHLFRQRYQLTYKELETRCEK